MTTKIYYPKVIDGTEMSAPLDAGRVKSWSPNHNQVIDLYTAVSGLGARNTAATIKAGDIIGLSPPWGAGFSVEGREVGNLNITRAAIIGDLPDDSGNANKPTQIVIFDHKDIDGVKDITPLATLYDIANADHRADTSAGSPSFKKDVTLENIDGLQAFSNKLLGIGIRVGVDSAIEDLFPFNNKAANADAADYQIRVQFLIQRVDQIQVA